MSTKVRSTLSGTLITPYTPVSDLPEILSVDETCTWLRRSRNTVYDAVKSGQLPSVRLAGRKIGIPRSALQERAAHAASQREAERAAQLREAERRMRSLDEQLAALRRSLADAKQGEAPAKQEAQP